MVLPTHYGTVCGSKTFNWRAFLSILLRQHSEALNNVQTMAIPYRFR